MSDTDDDSQFESSEFEASSDGSESEVASLGAVEIEDEEEELNFGSRQSKQHKQAGTLQLTQSHSFAFNASQKRLQEVVHSSLILGLPQKYVTC